VADTFGYASKQAFQDALDRELEQMASHSHQGEARPGQQAPPKQQRQRRPPDVKTPDVRPRTITGKPGSPEREKAVRAVNPELFDQAKAEQRLAQADLLVRRWAESETDEYDSHVVQELARIAWDVQDANVFYTLRDAIEQIAGEEQVAAYDGMMAHRIGVAEAEAREQEREVVERHQQHVANELQAEYEVIERKLGTDALIAADEIAQVTNEAGLLYDGDPEITRASLRAAAEVAAAQKRTGDTFALLQDIGEEMKRHGAPGSRWTDAERAEWEAEMEAASFSAADRQNEKTDPDEAAARAIRSRALERAGTSILEQELEREFAEMAAHDSTAEHRVAMDDAAVAEWDRTHDSAGRETTDQAEEFRR
jgi:hypothetical protein